MFAAIFTLDAWPVTEAIAVDCAVIVGLDRAPFECVVAEATNESVLTERAAADGAFCVPRFALDDKLCFGNDRLVLVDHDLKLLPQAS